MTPNLSIPEFFIQTLAEMLREDRANKALRLVRQATSNTVEFSARQRRPPADSDIPVDQFSLFHSASTARHGHGESAGFSITRNTFLNGAMR
jgi:hypothetical protein